MSIDAGIAWSKTNEKKETYISGPRSDDLKAICPQLANFNFILRHIPNEKRKSDKSPHWNMSFFIPKAQNTEEPSIPNEIDIEPII